MSLKTEIEIAYRKSGNTMGWRLLYSPESTLHHAKVAFIGLNPGGSTIDARHSKLAMPEGQCAYVNESWAGHVPGNSPLQRQVLSLFDRLDVLPQAVLAGNLVPFRSPDWANLQDPKGSLAFGKQLWARILRKAAPSTIITMGKDATNAVTDVLNISDTSMQTVGWGNITASRGTYDGGVLIGLPHLSRFGIMTRPASAKYLDCLFEGL